MFAAVSGHTPGAGGIYYSSLPLWAVLVPLLAGLLLGFLKPRPSKLLKAAALLFSFAAFAVVMLMLPLVLKGAVVFSLKDYLQLGLFFKVELIDWVFAFLISFVWLLATFFSFVYMDFEHRQVRFYSFLIITLGATLGVVLSADFFTLFLFFEAMTLSSFILVIHEQDCEAMEAGMLYLYLGLAGGLALLFAIMLFYQQTGTVEMTPLLPVLGAKRTLIFILFLIGFGIKAGLAPLHIWLPKAHPVAPSPASALLSGIMIKTGAYGIFKTALVLFQVPGQEATGHSAYLFALGNGLMWVGMITMFSGALMALLQGNMKRMLAYSSVSQIGYIATGLGAALFMEAEGAMGFTGAIYHVINHAFFKAGLFLVAGTIFMYTRELELDRLGGLFKKMPFAGTVFLVCAAGIAGIPGFNGYASKTLIHDALLLAIKAYPFFSIKAAETIFNLTSALTICYFMKLFRGVFLGKVPENLKRLYPLALSTKLSLGTFAAVIMAIGLFPNFILENFLLRSAEQLYYRGEAMGHLTHFHFFEWAVLKPMAVVVILACLIYFAGERFKWFNLKPPAWLSIEASLYRPLVNFLYVFTGWAGLMVDQKVNGLYLGSAVLSRQLCGVVVLMESEIDKFYQKWGLLGSRVARSTAVLDEGLNQLYLKSGGAVKKLAEQSAKMDSGLDRFYLKSGQTARKFAEGTHTMDEVLNRLYLKSGEAAKKLAEKSAEMDNDLNQFYLQSGRAAKKLADKTSEMDSALDHAYQKTGFIARLLTRFSLLFEQRLNYFYDGAAKKLQKTSEKRRAKKSDKLAEHSDKK